MATVLLVIDVQRGLVDALDAQRRASLLETLDALLKRARRSGTPVVYVRHDGSPHELCAGSAEWQIADEIAPVAAEPIVDKRFRDAFRETNLADVLRALDADHLVISGMQTEYCIDSTVREGERRGYRVTLVEDGTATFPADGASEAEIRAHVHRVVRDEIARIVPAGALFA